ncbi:MAG TPA: hypothetical protein VM120_23270 [Bryobacteraceae bacterium]|nr:hypothetical protein [Bryobacteraceae bacterium]
MTNSTWASLPSVLSRSSKPIRLVWSDGLRDRGRAAIAGADIRRREIHLDPELQNLPEEQSRILTHEIFHFVWVRLGNPRRASWKALLGVELARHARGELGWSSQWRKEELPKGFAEYSCEAFCDTGAWLYSGCGEHREYTLARRWREGRRAWFERELRAPVVF